MKKNLKLILKIFGEEKEASKIAKKIIKFREKKKFFLVKDLVEIIRESKKKYLSKKIDVSTQTFQALRIFVNNEISELIYGLINSAKILKKGGILAVVTFHSLEDKIVKYFFKNLSQPKSISRYKPKIEQKNIFFKMPLKKPIVPSNEEIKKNPPSRSAKLRYIIKEKDVYEIESDIIDKFSNLLEIEKIGFRL